MKIDKSKFNIKIVKDQKILCLNDQPVLCIYKTPTVLPHGTIQGQAVIFNPVCSDHCPMFNLIGTGIFNKLKLECTKHEIEVYINHDLL